MEGVNRELLEKRPGVLMIGSPNVGKRTLLSRLLSLDFEGAFDSTSDTFAYGWTINTKYYVADVSLWMAHLHDEFSIQTLPVYERLAALVMVFDMNDLSSFIALKDWVSQADIQQFDILLCIGNKVDLLPGHPAHVEYRRRLLKLDESSGNFTTELDYGISETEGSSLLGEEESSWEIKRSHMDWCVEHNIEYIEACGSNANFDDCLSVDGDLQGVQRLYGALSAHMWPGMVLKSGDKIDEPSLPEQELSEEDSDIELEYEILSGGSAEPWDDTEVEWLSANADATTSGTSGATEQTVNANNSDGKNEIKSVKVELEPSTSTPQSPSEMTEEEVRKAPHPTEKSSEPDEGTAYDFEDLEQLMSEIGNMRDSLRLLPDFQRREMEANLAMKMAAMFGDSGGDEEGFD